MHLQYQIIYTFVVCYLHFVCATEPKRESSEKRLEQTVRDLVELITADMLQNNWKMNYVLISLFFVLLSYKLHCLIVSSIFFIRIYYYYYC